MTGDIIPTENIRTWNIIHVEPSDKSKTLLFLLFRKGLEYQEQLRKKQEERFLEYDVTSVDIESDALPEQTERFIKLRSFSQWKRIYENALLNDYNLFESYEKFSGNKYHGKKLLLQPDNIKTKEDQIILDILEDDIVLDTKNTDIIPSTDGWIKIRLIYTDPETIEEGKKQPGIKNETLSEWKIEFGDRKQIYSTETTHKVLKEDIDKLNSNPDINVLASIFKPSPPLISSRFMLLLYGKIDYMFLTYTRIVKELIKNFDLDYCYIPQKEKIILSTKEIPFKTNKFTKDFPQKQKLTIEESVEILETIGTPEKTIQRFKNNRDYASSEKLKLEELEILARMRDENIIDDQDLECYKYTPLFSNGTKESMLEVLEKGNKNREALYELSFKANNVQDIISNINNTFRINKAGHEPRDIFSRTLPQY